MKIRSNYVSNSSSSSYIVEYKNLEDKITVWGKDITVEDFLNQIMFYTYGDENELFENTFENDEDKKEIINHINHIKEHYTIDDKYDIEKLKDDIMKSDSNFVRFNIGYHDIIGHAIFDMFVEQNVLKKRFFMN